MATPTEKYPEDLHGIAAKAEKCLEKLATGLASAGADPQAVKAVEEMADVIHEVVVSLGKGQEATGDDEPPAEQPASFDQAAAETQADMQAAAAQRGA